MSLKRLLSADGQTRIRARLITEVGGYLRNAVREPHVTCTVCATPVRPEFDLCRRCHEDRQQFGGQLAELVVPVFYGIKGRQSGYQMHSYKDLIAPTPRHRNQLSMLLLAALGLHGECIEDQLGHEIEAWAIVPSTQAGRTGEHPLRVVTRQIQLRLPEIELATRPETHLDERVTSTDRFAVTAADTPHRHILLIEDTWTTGAKCQSAALTLRRAGAASVTILALARWLNPRESGTGAFIKNRLTANYNPLLCPVSNPNCPHSSQAGQ